ncbi:MAG: LruC domain-containing protein [Methylotetracoccus sp.]
MHILKSETVVAMFTKRYLVLSLTAALSTPSMAIDWQYFGSYNPKNGVPDNMINVADTLPTGLLDIIHKKLPESIDIRKNDPSLIADDFGANLYLVEDADVRLVFVYEGAGYQNSVGIFDFDPNAQPTAPDQLVDRIVFPNTSTPPLKAGDAIELGRFKAGSALGFTIVSDGWKPGLGKVNPNQSKNSIFRSLMGLNPEKPGNDNLNAHAVLLSKPEDGLLVLGFEDLNRESSSDDDFNDVLLALQVTPYTAVERSSLASFNNNLDSDKDGVPDSLDAFPRDPEKSSRRYYPSATGQASLMFEDQWPKAGDYDLNDVVIGYRVIEELNPKGQVVDVKLFYDVLARGAANHNGFGVHLPGILPDQILLADAAQRPLTTIRIGDKDAVALTPEQGQNEAVFIMDPDVTALTTTGESGDCAFFNTVNGCPYHEPIRITAEIHFKEPLDKVGTPPYNPFIFSTSDRGKEIHLIDQPPTLLANPKLFGTDDDASDPSTGRYYRTAANKVWAIDVPDIQDYPAERYDLATVYQEFGIWAESSGRKSADWFQKGRDENRVYKPKK